MTGMIIVPIFGQRPLQASDEFLHIIHLVSLNLILFSSGLDTKFSTIRSILRYGIVISTIGVAISAAIIGTLFYLFTSENYLGFQSDQIGAIPFNICLLIGTCLSSTDAGASMSILNKLRIKLPERLFNIIKFESAINDPAAVIAYGLVATWIMREASISGNIATDATSAANLTFRTITDNFVGLFSTGTLVGLAFGYFSIWMLKNLDLRKEQLLSTGIATVSLNYAISNYIGGSGLISAFISGMVLSNLHKSSDITIIDNLKASMEPFVELAEILIYFSFAARINPESLFNVLPLGLLCAFLMMFIARPLSIYIFQPFSRLNWRESSLLGWCGFKGAVTLALSYEMVDVIAKAQLFNNALSIELAQDIQSIIFITAITNLLVQSLSMPTLAAWTSQQCRQAEAIQSTNKPS